MSMIFIPGDRDYDLIRLSYGKFVLINYFEDEECTLQTGIFNGEYRRVQIIEQEDDDSINVIDGGGKVVREYVEENPNYAPDFAYMANDIRTKQIAELEKENPGMHFW